MTSEYHDPELCRRLAENMGFGENMILDKYGDIGIFNENGRLLRTIDNWDPCCNWEHLGMVIERQEGMTSLEMAQKMDPEIWEINEQWKYHDECNSDYPCAKCPYERVVNGRIQVWKDRRWMWRDEVSE